MSPSPHPSDCSTPVGSAGVQPKLVAGSRENLKVTWPEDFAIAEAILSRQANA